MFPVCAATSNVAMDIFGHSHFLHVHLEEEYIPSRGVDGSESVTLNFGRYYF